MAAAYPEDAGFPDDFDGWKGIFGQAGEQTAPASQTIVLSYCKNKPL
jgi:hypothetical protein